MHSLRLALRRCGLALAALILPLSLAGCGQQDIYSKLSESEANEIVAALGQADISASKREAGKEGWSVAVDDDQFARAVDVLRAKGLPKNTYASLGQVFEKKGFVSSPIEERARLNYGLSQELSHTLSEIDGVVEARVHLAIPEADPLSQDVKPSSAAVFVKYQPGFDLRGETGAIKALVTNSVEGLAYDRVSVIMVASQVAREDDGMALQGTSSFTMAGLLALLGLGGLGAVFVRDRRAQPRRREHLPEPAE
ncbi:type III secretion system inner membrane ring lipoprotein SctJ [Novosphingobium sp. RD2P27]|uniref:Lipoprotein n=1 Tax=Novosphingobium kalidii TaxID=3230299 RepID=A0ABV2D1Q7_9SPHN